MTDHCDHCHSTFTDPKTIVTHPFMCVLALEVNGNRNNPVFEELKLSCEEGKCIFCEKKFPTGTGNQLNHLLKSCNVKFPNKKKVRKVASTSTASTLSVISSDNPVVISLIKKYQEQLSSEDDLKKDLQTQLFLKGQEVAVVRAKIQAYKDLASIANDPKRILAHEELKVKVSQLRKKELQRLLIIESNEKIALARLQDVIMLKKQLANPPLILTKSYVADMIQSDLESLEDLVTAGLVIVETDEDMMKRFNLKVNNKYYHHTIEESIVDDCVLDLDVMKQSGLHMGLDSSLRAGMPDKMTELTVSRASGNLSKAKLEMTILKERSSASVSDITIKEAEIVHLTDVYKIALLEREQLVIEEEGARVPIAPEIPPLVYEIVCHYCSFIVSTNKSMKQAQIDYRVHLSLFHCDKHEAVVNSQKTVRGDGSIKAPRKNITRKRRLEVWERWIGVDCGSVDCPLCLTSKIKPLDGSSWNVSHVVPHCHGGTIDVENLRVICAGCNSSMSSMNMRDYCEMYHPSAIVRLGL